MSIEKSFSPLRQGNPAIVNPLATTTDLLLADVAIRVQLSFSNYRLAVERYETLRNWVERDASPLKDKVELFYPQGSMAINATIASKLDKDDFDVDVIVQTNHARDVKPERILDDLLLSIKGEEGSQYYKATIRNTRCVTVEYPRQLVKAAFTKSINADDERKAWGAFNDDMQTNDDLAEWRHLSQLEHYRELIRQLRHHHPVINDYIHSNHGLSLMYHDSRVAAWVLDSMTAHNGEGISCLCVHDSFLVDARHEAVLRAYMEEAYRALGMPHGLPEIRATQSALA